MGVRTGACIGVVAVCLLAAGRLSAQVPDSPVQAIERLRAGHTEALKALDEITDIHVVGETKEVGVLTPQTGLVVRGEHKKSGDHYAYTQDRSGEPIPVPGVKLGQPTQSFAHGANSKYTFALERKPGATAWMLKSLAGAGTQGPPDPTMKRVWEQSTRVANGELAHHFRLYNSLVVDHIGQKKLTVTKVEPADGGKVRLGVKVDYPVAAQDGDWLVCDPANHYCIAEYQVTERWEWAGMRCVLRGKYEYAAGTPPLLAGSVENVEVFKGAEKVYHVRKERTVTVKSRARLPETEFTLTAYGLPEPAGVEFAKPTPPYVWVLAAAGGCAVLALAVRLFARRGRKEVPVAATV